MAINYGYSSPLKEILNPNQILNLVGEYLLDKRNDNFDFEINKVSSLENINENSVLFLEKKSILKVNYNNLLIITNCKSHFSNTKFTNIALVKNINAPYNIILNKLYYHEDQIEYNDEFSKINNSFISKFAKIDPSAVIYNNCVIGRGVVIGKNCIIKNNVVIKNSIIGNNVIISDNSVIGSSGFGFDLKNMGAKNLTPQIGLVLIKDNVYIGSNCSIDRGKIDNTIIGENSMLDNLIHVAHNVVLGKNTCIAAQTGISGSVIFGDNTIIGGQAGFAGHIKIGHNVVIAAKSGVTKNISDNSVIAGFPATDIKEWKKQIINNKKNGYK